MDLDKDLAQKLNEMNAPGQETEAERVLRESLERGRQRAEQSRMVEPWFAIGMMTLIVVTMIGLMLFVNNRLTNKKPAGPSYKKTANIVQEPAKDDFKVDLTKRICFESVDMCLSYPDNWNAGLTKSGSGETIVFNSKDNQSRLGVAVQPSVAKACDATMKARVFERKTVAIRQLGLENVPEKTNLWARSFVRQNISGQAGDRGLEVGLYYPVLALDNITHDDRKYAVVGNDQINGCQVLENERIKAKNGAIFEVVVSLMDQFFASNNQSQSSPGQSPSSVQSGGNTKPTYSPVSSEQKALDFLKTDSARTMYEILASAKSAQAKN